MYYAEVITKKILKKKKRTGTLLSS